MLKQISALLMSSLSDAGGKRVKNTKNFTGNTG